MTAQEAYILAKAYTNKSIEGAGSLKGAACQIKSIEAITGGHRITFEWENNDGEVSTDTMDVMDGADGNDGVGISSITYKETDAHGNYVYTVTLTDTNTYDIICPKGAQGETGATGATGNGIASIVKTSTAGLVDTYTITYTNGQTTTFTVTNGESITVDSAMSDSSTNPVQNKVITEALALKQDVTDNSLETTAKTIVGAINENAGDISSLKSGLTNYELQSNINFEVPNRKNLAGNPYNVMLNSSGVFVVANVRTYIVPTGYGKITISVNDITKISDNIIRIGYCDDIPAESGTGVRVSSMTTNTYTITPNTGYKYIVVSNLLDNDYGWQDIQIELGSTATAYTPYIPSVESRLAALEAAVFNS